MHEPPVLSHTQIQPNMMMKSLRFGFVALSTVALFASCGNDAGDEVRDAARDATEMTEDAAVTGANALDGMDGLNDAVPTGPTTTMAFKETEFNFGTVAEGEKVKHTYTFTNEGSEPLVLSNAVGSCGCTVPVWPREPIAPGASGEVVVEFNSQGKAGERDQKVTITANTNPAQTFLSLQGTVEPQG